MITEFPKTNFVLVWIFNNDIHSMKFSWVDGELAAYDFVNDTYELEHGVSLGWAKKLEGAYTIVAERKVEIE